jgi:dTDP-4-dehydrorhamnose reductase
LGRALSRLCDIRGLDHALVSRSELDIADADSVRAALACYKPWAVVNTAGFVRVADAEREREACMRENALGAEVLARACADLGIPFVTFSSDLVFDGRLGRPYVESDAVNPTSVYGESKAEAERRVLAAHDKALVIRTSAFFGPWDRFNFVWRVLNEAAAGNAGRDRHRRGVTHLRAGPRHAVLDLLIDGDSGIRHLTSPGALSWSELARDALRRGGYDAALVEEAAGEAPLNTALTSERGPVAAPAGERARPLLPRQRGRLGAAPPAAVAPSSLTRPARARTRSSRSALRARRAMSRRPTRPSPKPTISRMTSMAMRLPMTPASAPSTPASAHVGTAPAGGGEGTGSGRSGLAARPARSRGRGWWSAIRRTDRAPPSPGALPSARQASATA